MENPNRHIKATVKRSPIAIQFVLQVHGLGDRKMATLMKILLLCVMTFFGASCAVREGIVVQAPEHSCYDLKYSLDQVYFVSCTQIDIVTSAPSKLSWRMEVALLQDLEGSSVLDSIKSTTKLQSGDKWCAYVRQRLAQSPIKDALPGLTLKASMIAGYPTCSYILERFGRQSETAFALVGTKTIFIDYFVVPGLAEFDQNLVRQYISERIFVPTEIRVLKPPYSDRLIFLNYPSFLRQNSRDILMISLLFFAAVLVGYYIRSRRG